jgi:arylsulfatase A-like enzyme
MAKIEYSDDRFSGISFLPLIVDPNSTWTQKAVYSQTNGNELYGIQRSVMTKEWKYVYNGFDFDELYDLVNDPNQMINLADKDETDIIQKELSILLWKFAYEHKDVCINPYIMVSLAKYGPGVAFGWE